MTQASPAFAELIQDRDSAAFRRHRAGQKIIGYLSNTIPVEIIDASGAMPLMLSGKPEEEPVLANQLMEPAFDPITRSVFNRILRGDYSFVDLIVLPRCNDAYQRLYYYLREVQRNYSEYTIPPVYLLDLLHTPWASSQKHNTRVIAQFANYLASLTGNAITAQSLNDAIERYNVSRNHLADFNRLRARGNAVSGELAYRFYASAQSLPVTSFNSLAEEINRSIAGAAPDTDNKPRLVIVGNSVDHFALHRCIDNEGARIVGDYHAYGQHFLTGKIENSPTPLQAITEHYHRQTLSSRTFFPPTDGPIQMARTQNAKALLFFFLQGEEALTWQVPKQKQLAQQAGLFCKVFYDQSYRVDSDWFKAELGEFIRSLSRSTQSP